MTSAQENKSAGRDMNPIEKMKETADKTIDRIQSLGLKPIPPIYELWFRYFEGDNAIVNAIDSHAGVIDEDLCLKLHKKLLTETAIEEAVKKVSDQMQSSIDELTRVLGTVQTATAEYGQTLERASGNMGNISTIDQLKMAVNSIVTDTRKMVEKNQELEIQLVNSSNQVVELRKNLDNVKKEVLIDGLTGLYNRKAFDKNIVDMMDEAARVNQPLTLLMMDIDYFKQFNDNFGHQVGDQVLRLVARTLTDNVKGRDVSARYGGEEFAIILPETNQQNAIRVAESLRKIVESKEIVNKTTNKVLDRITLSIGVAEYKKGEGMTELVARADKALYDAKRAGRNCVIAWTEDSD